MTEVNVKAAPADDTNPLRNAFLMEETLLRNEKDAQRSLDLASSRRWGVFNPSATNTLAQPAGTCSFLATTPCLTSAKTRPYAGAQVSSTITVMSATKVGFKLVPVGFFSKNPALDVPRPRR